MASITDAILQESENLFNRLRPAPFSNVDPGPNASPYEQTAMANLEPSGWVNNSVSTVIIDENGITITDGALTLSDQFGNNVITGAGFGASWLDFINEGFYNGHFQVGTTNDIVAVTEVGAADTEAEYLASLSSDIPYWIVQAESGAGTLKRIADSTAVGGFALQWAGTEDALVYQDVPILAGRRYNVSINWRYTNAASDFTREVGYQFRKADHSGIGVEADQGINFTTSQAAYAEETLVTSALAPADARYMRILMHISRGSGSPTIWINSFRIDQTTSGTTFPVPAVAGDRFYRTDKPNGCHWYKYDGTRWLSDQLFIGTLEHVGSATLPIAATETDGWRWGITNTASILVESYWIAFHVAGGGTALSASHKWDTKLEDQAGTTISNLNIVSGASSTWRQAAVGSNSVQPSTNFQLAVTATKTGTPGNLYLLPTFQYRFIAT